MRAWNTVRDATAIQATKNTLVDPLSTGLGLYYRFDGDVSDSVLDISKSHRWAQLIKSATSVSPSQAPIGFASYNWTPGGATTSSIAVNPAFNTNYTLTVTDYKGTTASASLLVPTLVSNTIETVRVCGSSYTWHGNTYTESTNTPTWKGQNQLGCDSNVTLHLTLLQLPAPVITGPDKICLGSAATLSAVGYSGYVWSPGGETTASIAVQPTDNTTYTVSVTDANGCSTSASTTIQVKKPSAFTEKTVACGSYTWHGTRYTSSNNTATWVGVNAAGCDSLVTLNLTITSLPAPAIVPYQYSINGGEFQPNPTFRQLPGGDYTVRVQDSAGCVFTVPAITIAQHAQPITITFATTDVSCLGGSDGAITATAINGYGGYLYSINGGAYQPGNTFTGLSAGFDTIQVKDTAGCTATDKVKILQSRTPCDASVSSGGSDNPTSNTAEIHAQLKVKVSPNPAQAEFNMQIVKTLLK